MAHKTKRQNNGQTELDTTLLRVAQRESALRRKCPRCGRKGAMVKVHDGVYHFRYCRFCDYIETH